LPGLFEKKMIVCPGSFLGPRGYWDFRSGGYLEIW